MTILVPFRYDLPAGTTYAELLKRHGLVEFFHKHLVPGFSQDDVVLQVSCNPHF